jgi:hypothetical protein
MARHILAQGERPVFAYGADYNGGSALTAYIGAIVFFFVGPREIALKCVPLVFSLVALSGVYVFVRAARGTKAAFWAAVFYGTSVSLLKWNFDARGGYAECQALLPLTFWLLGTRALLPGRGVAAAGVVGLLSGFGVYLLQMFIPVGLTCLLFLAFARESRLRRIGAFASGACLGAFPLLWRGSPAGSVGLDPRPLLGRLGGLPAALFATFTRYLPGLLSYDNFEGYPPFRLLPNALEYLFLIVGLSLLALKGSGRGERPVPVEKILVVYSGIYLLLFCLHPLAGNSPRYLLFLVPGLSILTALGVVRGFERGGASFQRALLCVLVASVLVDRGVQAVALAKDDGIYGPDGSSSPQTADALIAFLRDRNVSRLVTEDWDLGWRVAFKTGETVLVSHNLNNLHQAPPFVVVVPANSEDDRRVAALLQKRSESVEKAGLPGKTVYAVGATPSGPGRTPEAPRS